MSIFQKSKEEKEDYGKEDKRIEKGLKDLKPENKKVRKEPPKPWGKKERLGVLIFFLVTVLIVVVLSLTSRDWKLPNLPRLKFPEISFLTTKTYLVTPRPLSVQNDYWLDKEKEITNYFKDKVKPLTGHYVFYFFDLNEGYSFGYDEEETMVAASLIKLPVLVALYQEAERGNIDLEQKYSLKDEDKVKGSGSLYSRPAGTILTFRELAYLMGQESDNTAFNVVVKTLGQEKIEETINNLGMEKTSLTENTTTAKDIGDLLVKLVEGSILSEESQKEIVASLTNTIYEAWISRDIKDVIVAHKFGREQNVTNDAGIIFSEKPFVLVILSQGIVILDSDSVIPEIAREIYSLVE